MEGNLSIKETGVYLSIETLVRQGYLNYQINHETTGLVTTDYSAHIAGNSVH